MVDAHDLSLRWRRFSITLQYEFQLQARNGFYAAAGFVLLSIALLLSQVPLTGLEWLLPPLLLNNLFINCFYFVAGLLLLERAEGSLLAGAVSPLRADEYLAARVCSLTLLALAESLVLVLLFAGPPQSWWALLAGLSSASIALTLAGIVLIAGYRSINEFLMPSLLMVVVLGAPLLAAFARWQHPLFYLHPLQPALLLTQAAFAPPAGWQLWYGMIGSGLWIVPAWLLARRAYQHMVLVGVEGN